MRAPLKVFMECELGIHFKRLDLCCPGCGARFTDRPLTWHKLEDHCVTHDEEENERLYDALDKWRDTFKRARADAEITA
jgi:hypothetical protein